MGDGWEDSAIVKKSEAKTGGLQQGVIGGREETGHTVKRLV